MRIAENFTSFTNHLVTSTQFDLFSNISDDFLKIYTVLQHLS